MSSELISWLILIKSWYLALLHVCNEKSKFDKSHDHMTHLCGWFNHYLYMLYIELLHPWWGLKLQTLQCRAFVFLSFGARGGFHCTLHFPLLVMRNMKRSRDWWDEEQSFGSENKESQINKWSNQHRQGCCLRMSLARIPCVNRWLRKIHPPKIAPKPADGGPTSLGDYAGWGRHLPNAIQAKDLCTYNYRIKKLHGDERMTVT